MQRTLEEVRRLAEENPAQQDAAQPPRDRRPLLQRLGIANRGNRGLPLEHIVTEEAAPWSLLSEDVDCDEGNNFVFGHIDKDSYSLPSSSTPSNISHRQHGAKERSCAALANGRVETQSSTSQSSDCAIVQSEREPWLPQYSDHEGQVPGEDDRFLSGADYEPDESGSENPPDVIPSVGSNWHLHTQDPARCSPCRFLADPRGCAHGQICTFCHFSHDHLPRNKRKPRARPCKGQRERHRKQIDGLIAQVNAAPEEWDPDNAEFPPQIASNEAVKMKVVAKLSSHKAELLRQVDGERKDAHEQEFQPAQAQPKMNSQRRRDLRRFAERDAMRAAQAEAAAAAQAATAPAACGVDRVQHEPVRRSWADLSEEEFLIASSDSSSSVEAAPASTAASPQLSLSIAASMTASPKLSL